MEDSKELINLIKRVGALPGYENKTPVGRHNKKGLNIVCVDTPLHTYDGQKVPCAKDGGGIDGLHDALAHKYGQDGITRRDMVWDEKSQCLRVASERKNWRPDRRGFEVIQAPPIKPIIVNPPPQKVAPSTKAQQVGEMIAECFKKVQHRHDNDTLMGEEAFKRTQYEMRLPRELYDIYVQRTEVGFWGFKVVLGNSTDITLRHKKTGISSTLKLTDYNK